LLGNDSKQPLGGTWRVPTYVGRSFESEIFAFHEINAIISSVIPIITAKQRQNLISKRLENGQKPSHNLPEHLFFT